jgi:Flp pilus assembly protein TadD
MDTLSNEINQILALMQSDLLAAEQQLNALQQKQGDSSPLLLVHAMITSRQGRYDEGIQTLLKHNEQYPEVLDGYFNLGYCYHQVGAVEKAQAAFLKASELAPPEEILPMTLLGICYHQLGDCDNAKACFEKDILLKPADPIGWFYLLQVAKETGDYQTAIECQTKLTKMLEGSTMVAPHLAQFISRYDYYEWRSLSDKGQLTDVIARYNKQHTEALVDFYPESYLMPDDRDALIKQHKDSQQIWIVKPTSLSGGQNMSLIDDVTQAPEDPGWLVQQYISDPLLLHGKKFNCRLYILFESLDPLRVYWWQNGIVFIAAEPFEAGLKDLSNTAAHIANPLQHITHPGRVVAEDASEDGTGNFWSLEALKKHLDETGVGSDALLSSITNLVSDLVKVVVSEDMIRHQLEANMLYAHAPKFIGLDVVFDANLKAYLVEVEQYPGLVGMNPVTDHINESFKSDLMRFLCVPLMDKTDSRLSDMEQAQWRALEAGIDPEQFNFLAIDSSS